MERDSGGYKGDKNLFPGVLDDYLQFQPPTRSGRCGGWIFVDRQAALVQFAMASVAFIGEGLSRSLVKYLEGRARSVKEALEGPFT